MDKKIIAANFSKASPTYQQNSDLQQNCAQQLLNFFDETYGANFLDDKKILDLGSGTGYISKNLATKNLVELDISFLMLQKSTASKKINADFCHLPCKKNSFDIVISSFALQWGSDLAQIFAQINSILKKDGIFIFCLPIFGSLKEIKEANLQTEFFLLDFYKKDEIAQKLVQNGFAEVASKTELIEKKYQSGVDVLRKIKAIGANYSKFEKKIIARNKIEKFNGIFAAQKQNIASWNVGFFVYKKIPMFD